MAEPVSLTRTTVSVPPACATTRILPPRGVCRSALSYRFVKICRSASGSLLTAEEFVAVSNGTPRLAARPANGGPASPAAPPPLTARGSRCPPPPSLPDRSRQSPPHPPPPPPLSPRTRP